MTGRAEVRLASGFSITQFEKALDEQLAPEFAGLERTCFADMYKAAPADMTQFHAMFRRRCVVLAIRQESRLVGMAFVEEVGPTAGYLRVVCVDPEYRGQGLGAVLMHGVTKILDAEGWMYLAFTAERAEIARLAAQAGLNPIKGIFDEGTQRQIEGYNAHLAGRRPGDVLHAYHERPNGEYVDSTFYLMKRCSR